MGALRPRRHHARRGDRPDSLGGDGPLNDKPGAVIFRPKAEATGEQFTQVNAGSSFVTSARPAAALCETGDHEIRRSRKSAAANLVLDELVTNIIKYGFDDAREHQIRVEMEVGVDLLTISVEDDGKPFNPLEAPSPNLDLPIEDWPIGGLGVFIVKSIAAAAEARRRDRVAAA